MGKSDSPHDAGSEWVDNNIKFNHKESMIIRNVYQYIYTSQTHSFLLWKGNLHKCLSPMHSLMLYNILLI